MKITIDLDRDVVASLAEYAKANGLTVPEMVALSVLEKHAPERFAERMRKDGEENSHVVSA